VVDMEAVMRVIPEGWRIGLHSLGMRERTVYGLVVGGRRMYGETIIWSSLNWRF
jgi:hypothetical protein